MKQKYFGLAAAIAFAAIVTAGANQMAYAGIRGAGGTPVPPPAFLGPPIPSPHGTPVPPPA